MNIFKKLLFSLAALLLSILALNIKMNSNHFSIANVSHAGLGYCTTPDGSPGEYQQGGICQALPNAANGATPTPAVSPGSCAYYNSTTRNVPTLNADGTYQQDSDGNTVTHQEQGSFSTGGLIGSLCSSVDPNRNAIQVILEKLSDYILGLGTYIFVVMILLGIIQTGVSGGSPSGVQAGKKRIGLAVSSIALLWLGRLFFTLTGITGGNFLGVPVTNGFTAATIPQVIAAVGQYLTYIGGALSVTFIIIGGIRMMTSSGNPQGIKQAGKIITYAVISLVAIGGLGLIFQLIKLIITGSQ